MVNPSRAWPAAGDFTDYPVAARDSHSCRPHGPRAARARRQESTASRGDGLVKFCTRRFRGNVTDVATWARAIQADAVSAADEVVGRTWLRAAHRVIAGAPGFRTRAWR